MFIPVQVQPEIGEIAAGLPYPYLENKQIQTAYVHGVVEKVDNDERQILIHGFKKWIPFHRIIAFSFGGVEITNTEYDNEKIWKEDRKIIDQIRDKVGRGY